MRLNYGHDTNIEIFPQQAVGDRAFSRLRDSSIPRGKGTNLKAKAWTDAGLADWQETSEREY